jgi:putative SOS response-associated peptidase YedK
MRPVHDRMPVLVPQSKWDEWLDPANDRVAELASIFDQPDPGVLGMYPVSTEVNNVRNNGPELLDRRDD